MTDTVEVLQELSALILRHPVPYFLKDKLMPVSYDPTHKGDMKRRDIVFLIMTVILWQKALAACSTLVKVA